MNRRAFNQTLSLALGSLPLIVFTSAGMDPQQSKKPNKTSQPKQKPAPPSTEKPKSSGEWKVYSHEELGIQCLLPPGAWKAAQGLGAEINQHIIHCAAAPNTKNIDTRCQYTDGFIKGNIITMEQAGYKNITYEKKASNALLTEAEIVIKGVVYKETAFGILQPTRAYEVAVKAPVKVYDTEIVARVLNSFRIVPYVKC